MMILLGIFLGFIGICFIGLGIIVSDFGPAGMGIIFCVLGWQAIQSKLTNVDYKNKFDRYKYLIIQQDITDIYKIAAAVGDKYIVVENDIERMIRERVFEDVYPEAYLDKENHRFVKNDQKNKESIADKQKQKAQNRVSVKCSNCGANSHIEINGVVECEYCGSRIRIDNRK